MTARNYPAVITTPRLRIMPYRENDISALKSLLYETDIGEKYMIPEYTTDEAALSLCRRLIDMSHADKPYERGIFLGETLIGFVNEVEADENGIELGYVIHPGYRNMGYATEMFGAVIEAMLALYTNVTAGAFADNAASIRVMEKCGMHKNGREDDIVYRGKTHHCVYLSLT